jgi:hypothetical protein
MTDIQPAFKSLLRTASTQGIGECLLIGLIFGGSLYLYTGDAGNLSRLLVSFGLISLKLYEPPASVPMLGQIVSSVQRAFWLGLIPVLDAVGLLWSPVLLYSSLQAHLFYRMMEGMSKSFTVGELFLNSHMLITFFEYSWNCFSTESAIVFYPVWFR